MERIDKDKLKATAGKTLVRILLILFVVIEAYPFIWNLMSSFKTNTEFLTDPMAFPNCSLHRHEHSCPNAAIWATISGIPSM